VSSLVLDTRAVVWALLDRSRLSAAALTALETANQGNLPVYVPAICIVEVVYLVEKGRLPNEVKNILMAALDSPESNLKTAPLDRDVAERVGAIPRDAVPEMPDRIIAATAAYLGLPLVSRDRRIQSAGLAIVW
jgi:PIN domain nuclease of toxin-antitoxin system